ncbi:MAG: TIGR04283 family arsenosugar biosynthesis glycosyltransferase [Gammaproteobacteria bacterium]|nr:MAG: TIGR04283 family arsenosugar biosynthesis glycosyltransferase [Gammaproteobacteria bacterium]
MVDDLSPSVSIIIPVLNESLVIKELLSNVLMHKVQEIIIVDGGSTDDTCELVESVQREPGLKNNSAQRILLLRARTGRARQMNAGAAVATSNILLFLHADTILPLTAIQNIRTAFSKQKLWGRFNVRLDGHSVLFRMIESNINIRSCITGMATGDQAIFIPRVLFKVVGAYADIPLMEDIDLCKRLKSIATPACIQSRVITSARRWQKNGIVKTICMMWMLRCLYALGVSPHFLARYYHHAR